MELKPNRAFSILAASALTLGTCLPAGLAFADPATPSVGEQSGAGSTAMTMVWENADQEYGGTEDPNNPNPTGNPGDDGYDPTAPGANLGFTAPTAINFVAKANGELLAPSAGAVHIDNHSAFGIHVSSMKIDPNTSDGWNIVENAAAASGISNAVWGTIGPATDPLNWASYVPVAPSTDPIVVTTPSAWNMAAYDGEASTADQVALSAAGNVANLSLDLSTAKTFGTIHWYLKAGNAAASSSPSTPEVDSAPYTVTFYQRVNSGNPYVFELGEQVGTSQQTDANGYLTITSDMLPAADLTVEQQSAELLGVACQGGRDFVVGDTVKFTRDTDMYVTTPSDSYYASNDRLNYNITYKQSFVGQDLQEPANSSLSVDHITLSSSRWTVPSAPAGEANGREFVGWSFYPNAWKGDDMSGTLYNGGYHPWVQERVVVYPGEVLHPLSVAMVSNEQSYDGQPVTVRVYPIYRDTTDTINVSFYYDSVSSASDVEALETTGSNLVQSFAAPNGSLITVPDDPNGAADCVWLDKYGASAVIESTSDYKHLYFIGSDVFGHSSS